MAYLLQQRHALLDVAQVERVVEAAHRVRLHLGDLEHLAKLVDVARDQVEEGEALHVLGALVGHLDDLVVALLERLGAEPLPIVLSVERARGRERHVDVAALDCQVEARLLVLHEVESDLRVALLLQVGDDGMAAEFGLLDDAHHLVKLLLVQAELEVALGRIDDELLDLALAVEAVQGARARGREIQRNLERADDAAVAVGQQVLEVVERGEVEDVVPVPRAALDPDHVVDRAELLELAVADGEMVLCEESHVRAVG